MLCKKYFILLFQYNCIQLFTEVDGKITNIDFANGKNKLSNCVTFSYNMEDLEFLPDGDPFEVNNNSSFSDYLDFAGYHFDPSDAIEAIITSLIKNKMIPNLGKNDDILICLQPFYYETKELEGEEDENRYAHINSSRAGQVLGHNVYCYDMYALYNIAAIFIMFAVGKNIILGFPFQTILIKEIEDGHTLTFAPTIEKSVVEKIHDKYPLPSHIPPKLLRNVKNRIVVSRLFGEPLPDKAIYQNREIDIGNTELAKMFDEILIESAKLIKDRTEKISDNDTYILDFGMHPVIKEAFTSLIEKPVFVDNENNVKFICFMLRNMMIEHNVINDLIFKSQTAKRERNLEEGNDYFKYGGVKYYSLRYVLEFLVANNRKKPFFNSEAKDLESIKK